MLSLLLSLLLYTIVRVVVPGPCRTRASSVIEDVVGVVGGVVACLVV